MKGYKIFEIVNDFFEFFFGVKVSAQIQIFSSLLPLVYYKFKFNQPSGASLLLEDCDSNPAGTFF